MFELNKNENMACETITSLDIAEMTGKGHNDVMKDIKKYVSYMVELGEGKSSHTDLGNLKSQVTDYFIKSTYVTEQNKTHECYEVTKKGCDFYASKMTGIKGTEFSMKYIDRFHAMKEHLEQHQTQESYLIGNPIKRAEQWIEEQKEKQQLQLMNARKDQLIVELKPKADYTDTILQSRELLTISQIASDYGMSGTELNKLLLELGVQYQEGGKSPKKSKPWILYTKYKKQGYTHSTTSKFRRTDGSTGTNTHTKWTQKGRKFIYDLLKEKCDLVPIIEREESIVL